MRKRIKKGFTLIEVMFAIAASAVLILATGTLLVGAHSSFSGSWTKVQLQRDASYAMSRIARSIREGESVNLEAGSKSIRVDQEADWVRFAFNPGRDSLERYDPGGGPETILEGTVESLRFNVVGNTVMIDLTIKQGDLQNHFISTVMLRNSSG